MCSSDLGIYDPAAVTAIIDDHLRIVANQAQEENHMSFLWQLVNLDSWLDSIDEHVTGTV